MTRSDLDIAALSELQAAFAAFLRSPGASRPPAGLLTQLSGGAPQAEAALDFYRSSSRSHQRIALAAVYPVTAALVGESLFRALCEDYLDQPGSRSGDLHRLGDGFSDVIAAEPACRALAYLGEMAELEWRIHRSFFAADRSTTPGVDPAGLDGADLDRLQLVLAPSLALLRCRCPVGRIWRAHQPEATESLAEIDPDAGPEDLAIHRQPAGLCLDVLAPEAFDLLQASAGGASLAEALAAAEAAGRPLPDLNRALPRWLELGLVQGFALKHSAPAHPA